MVLLLLLLLLLLVVVVVDGAGGIAAIQSPEAVNFSLSILHCCHALLAHCVLLFG